MGVIVENTTLPLYTYAFSQCTWGVKVENEYTWVELVLHIRECEEDGECSRAAVSNGKVADAPV